MSRLPTHVEVAGILRRAQRGGRFRHSNEKGRSRSRFAADLCRQQPRPPRRRSRARARQRRRLSLAARPSRPNRPVPSKLRISSPSAHGSTRICGQSNWISRSPNGSSLKRPARLDPAGSCRRNPAQQQERGAFSRRKTERMPRETGNYQETQRKYSQVISAFIVAVHRKIYGKQCWLLFVRGCSSLQLFPRRTWFRPRPVRPVSLCSR